MKEDDVHRLIQNSLRTCLRFSMRMGPFNKVSLVFEEENFKRHIFQSVSSMEGAQAVFSAIIFINRLF